MFLLYYVFVFHIFVSRHTCNSVYQSGTSNRIREKFKSMVREIVMDGELKIRQIDIFKPYIEKQKAFKLGELHYEVSERIRRMLMLYRVTERKQAQHQTPYCIENLVVMDNLYHEAQNFIEMMKVVQGVDKFAPSKRIFRSNMEEQVSEEDDDKQTTTPPEVEKLSSKRSNGAWNYAPEDHFYK